MSETDWSNLPSWLPTKIKAAGLTVEKAANRSGVSRTMMYAYIQDQARPSETTARQMAKALGVRFEDVLSQYVPKKNGPPFRSGRTRAVTVRTR